MADMMRWDPWEEWKEMREKINERFLMLPFQGFRAMKEMAKGEWHPAVDIKETKDTIYISAELPGMTEDDIEINVTPNSIELKGERKDIKEIKEKNTGYYRKERSYGKFSRYFTLPAEVKVDKVDAIFKEGVLNISLPKRVESHPKSIKIKIKRETRPPK